MQVDQESAVKLMNDLKAEMRASLEKYSTTASAIAVNSTDPHSPIIGCVQMALIQASVEYMLTNGAPLQESVNITIAIMQKSFQSWIDSLIKQGARIGKAEKPSKLAKPKKSKLILPGQ